MLADQAVQINVSVGRLTGTVVQFALQQLMYRRFFGGKQADIAHGEQTIEQLNAQGRELKKVEIHEKDLQSIRDGLKRYGVDFTVMQGQAPNTYCLFFKAQDIERVHMGIEEYLKDLNREPMEEQIKEADKEAQERNHARQPAAQERSDIARNTAQEMEHTAAKTVEQEVQL